MYVFRLVHSGPDRGSPQPGGELSFATRTGTRLGIETHVFRAETCKDLSLWTRHIVTGCHAAAEMIKEVTTSKYSPDRRMLLSVLELFEAKIALSMLPHLAFCCTIHILLLQNNFLHLFRPVQIHIMCKIHWRIYPIVLGNKVEIWVGSFLQRLADHIIKIILLGHGFPAKKYIYIFHIFTFLPSPVHQLCCTIIASF